MNELHLRAVFAGLLFGLWPILMNRSGMSGFTSATLFALGAFLFVAPFGIYEYQRTVVELKVGWWFVISACVCGAVGLLFFNDMLAKANPKTLGSLFVFMIVVQVATPAVYQVMNDGGLSLKRALGFVAAVVAAILLV